MNIQELLSNYKEKKALLDYKKWKIESLETQLQYANQASEEETAETIAGMQMSAATISDMPKGGTNKISRTTEITALNYENEIATANDFDIMELKHRKNKLLQECQPLQEHITTVDIALSILSEKERYIIELKYLSECNIPEIVQRFADRYRYGSYNGIKKIIDESKNKMNNFLQKKSA